MVDGAAKGRGVMFRRLPEAQPFRTSRDVRDVAYWTRRLIDAEDKRREAEREYQQVLMHLRGALGTER